eukprot:GHVR01035327.1.p1 GENE.GHVR01035327.1~~GHVR01035327.1.p1  ORF type:complete len:335 (+),score=52.86 GHVR01035327.1:42-1046(+)
MLHNDDSLDADSDTYFCAYCYKQDPSLSLCAKCGKRRFCSKQCQESDWSTGHKHWCGVSGEIGFDYEVRESPGKGLGVFVLRQFLKNEKIMMERPLMRSVGDSLTSSGKHAVNKLLPIGGSIREKYSLNAMSLSFDSSESGLCVTMSRVNHDCKGNCDHYYSYRLGVKILVARRAIMEGEELNFTYCGDTGVRDTHSIRKKKLQRKFGFTCDCYVCRDVGREMRKEFDRMVELDNAISEYASSGNIRTALMTGKILLGLYEKHEESSIMFRRTYYDLYQSAITQEATVGAAKMFIREAYANIRDFIGDDDDDNVESMRKYAQNPTSHRNYLLLE